MINFIICGCSGTGKSSIIKRLVNSLDINFIKKDSTRFIRYSEVKNNYSDINFLYKFEFEKKKKNKLYLFTYKKHGNEYGILKKDINTSKHNILIIKDIDTIKKFIKLYKNTYVIYIKSNKKDLIDRLYNRYDINTTERIKNIDIEQKIYDDNRNLFNYVIFNYFSEYSAFNELLYIIRKYY